MEIKVTTLVCVLYVQGYLAEVWNRNWKQHGEFKMFLLCRKDIAMQFVMQEEFHEKGSAIKSAKEYNCKYLWYILGLVYSI